MDVPLQAMIESIGKSVSAAQQGLERFTMSNFFDFFSQKDMPSADQTLFMEAKTVQIAVPSQADISEDTVIAVPLVALAHHSHVALEQVKVRINANLFADEENTVKMQLNDASDTNSVEIVFNVSAPSEGIARMVQNITRKL
ncbi:MAG: DUF2589 domain-containing protein [Defluviitaleaceae bacterium]|nr:DUF2589 domain-containing protein [Defluviitaleaceae bacterium]